MPPMRLMSLGTTEYKRYLLNFDCSGILATMKSNGRTRNKGDSSSLGFPSRAASSFPSFKPTSHLLAHICIAFVLISSIAAAEEDVIRSRMKRRGKRCSGTTSSEIQLNL